MLAEVTADGRVTVTEQHTFTWQRPGHAAYVDIPLTSKMRVEGISVSEGDVTYHHSPDTAGRADRPPGTYRTLPCSGIHPIVARHVPPVSAGKGDLESRCDDGSRPAGGAGGQ